MREMKPAFALDFRDDTVSLLHRSGGGWHLLGAVPLDTPDLAEALTYLRSTALGIAPKGLTSKLIIPNDQILYTWVHAPGPSAEERHAQVTSGLEGRTPYDVADLAFDYSGDGPDLLVAVIAKETLAEAEGFAIEHRFNPVSFVAVPESADYKGEPWFGPTTAAADLVGKGKKVERDSEAVVVTPRGTTAEPSTAVDAPEPAPVLPPAEVEAPASAPEAPAQPEIEIAGVPEPSVPEPVVPEPEVFPPTPPEIPQPEPEPLAEPEAPEPDLPEPELPAPDLPEPEFRDAEQPPRAATPSSSVNPFEAIKPPPAFSDARDDRELIARLGNTLSQPIKQPERPLPPLARRSDPVEVEEAPMALDVQPEDVIDDEPQGKGAIKAALSAQSLRVTDTRIDDDLPPAPSSAALSAFNTRRQEGASPAAGKKVAGGAAPMLGGAPPNMARPVAKPALPVAGKAAKPAKTSALRGMGAFVGGEAASKRQKVEMPKASISAAATLDAPRSGDPAAPARKPLAKGPGGFALRAPARGKPRYLGLVLTVVLLFLLAMIAAWSSYSLGAWNSTGSDAVQSASTDPAEADVPDVNDEMLADMQDPEALADGQGSAAEALDQQSADALDPATSDLPVESAAVDPAPETATAPPQAPADQAAVAQDPASSNDGTQDEIFLAGMDAPPSAPDPLSLPQPDARGDPLPAAQLAPPPFGTVYQFDADGTIRPTPEGIITPEGVLLRAGKPPLVPEERPDAVTIAASAAEASAPETAAALPETAAAEVFADPALAGKLPKLRPDGLVPASPADQGSLAPASDSRFANLRPQARPTTVLAAGEAARLASSAATLTAAAPASDSATSPLAIAISRKPAARPRDMSRAVEAAIALAMNAPAPQPEPEPVATKVASKSAIQASPAAPEADGEPDVVASNRKTPLKTTVAKQATFKNAINLSKINLIGVYGTQSNRYALVRQANGRYKKVRVGDSIDGGRVAAITASEVRYQKGGRLISLAMPAG
jgi:hypothetical protein